METKTIDTQIGDMHLGGLTIGQLEVICRLAFNAETEFENNGRPEIANQCMVLRNRARSLREHMMLYPEFE